MEREINLYLLRLGFMSNVKGSIYLREALRILVNKKYLCNLKSDIYPVIAQKYRTSIENIEKNISNAIDRVFLRCDIDVLYSEFGSIDEGRAKPTVKEFLVHAKERVLAQYYENCEAYNSIS